MSETPQATTATTCPHCGASRARAGQPCWLCDEHVPDDLPWVESAEPADPQRFSFSLSTMMLLMTLASICLGLLVVAPGLGVVVCVILLPVYIRTMMVLRKREAQGMDVSPAAKISLFLGSFFTALVVSTVVLAASFGTFCLVCLTSYGVAGGRGGEEPYMLLSFLVAGGVTLLFARRLVKWIRWRYQRDVSPP